MRVPLQFVELCTDWHSGQDSMMYAIASTGRLSLGTTRPETDMSDAEWLEYLLASLESEIRYSLRSTKRRNDRRVLKEFLSWTEKEQKRVSVIAEKRRTNRDRQQHHDNGVEHCG